MTKIKIALPKGRFYDRSMAIIARTTNRDFCDIKKSKKLVFESEDYTFFLLKSSDICKFIFDKKIDIGIVPDEWILEYELQHKVTFDKLKRIEWVHTRISLISKSANTIGNNDVIASSYPFIVLNYLEQKVQINNHPDIKIYKLNGSIEATIPKIFAFGIDCVESGKTISCNDLVELDIIHDNLSLSLIKKNGSNLNFHQINNLYLD
ncbi:MAG: hypothetical protein ABIH78_03390 [Candidatus Peregrinibacteria bacterium]